MKTNLPDEPIRLSDSDNVIVQSRQKKILIGLGAYATHKRRKEKNETPGLTPQIWLETREEIRDNHCSWFKAFVGPAPIQLKI